MTCSRCRQALYCSKDCQRSHWKKEHKKICKSYHRKVNVGMGDRPDKLVDILPQGTHVVTPSASVDGDLRGKVMSFNVGKGPYRDPSVRWNPRKHPGQFIDDDDMCNYTIKFKDGNCENVTAIDIHSRWEIELPLDCGNLDTGKPRENQVEESAGMQGASAADSSTARAVGIQMPTEPKFLLVSGLMFQADECFYNQREGAFLSSQGIPFESIDFDPDQGPQRLSSALASGHYSACVLFGFCGFGHECFNWFNRSPSLKQTMQSWVRAGGALVIQGEGLVARLFQQWFGKPWCSASYSREDNTLNNSSVVPRAVRELLPNPYNVKAVALTKVNQPDALYFRGHSGPDAQVVVAVSSYGNGLVSFLGDVNAEPATISLISQIGQCSVSPSTTSMP